MQITNKVLVDLDGNTIKSGDVEMTVANVLQNCALAPTADGKPRPANEVASRYDLAIALNKLETGATFDVAPELVVKLKEDMLRVYATIVAGQMLPVLDGKVPH